MDWKEKAVGVVIALTLYATVPAQADDMDIAISPRLYTGKEIKLDRVQCIDDPNGGFLCLKNMKNRFILIKAVSLGRTSAETATQIIKHCTGTANITSRECIFDITVTPINDGRLEPVDTAQGTMMRTVFQVDGLNIRRRR